MKKIQIPRKDHEVYFIPLPKNLKKKSLEALAVSHLVKSHPGFSSSSVFDIQLFPLNNARWIMITVMDEETLFEYRILHKHSLFYTNTSLAIRKKDFIQKGIITIDDECIGFNTIKNSPVSFPFDQKLNINKSEHTISPKIILPWHGLFAKKPPKQRILALVASVFILAITLSSFSLSSKNKSNMYPVESTGEEYREIKYLPSAVEILANLSKDVLDAGGSILRWQYDEGSEPLIIVQLEGINDISIHKIIRQYEYFQLQDIRNVYYNNGKSQLTIQINVLGNDYSIPNALAFPAQNSILPLIRELTDQFQIEEITMASETLPTAINSFYTITYTAKDKNMIKSLDIFSDICKKYPLHLKSLDISISGDKHLFTIISTLAYSNSAIKENTTIDTSKIPLAFAYSTPFIPKTATAIKPASIGTIRSSKGEVVFYRDPVTGKMKTRRSYE